MFLLLLIKFVPTYCLNKPTLSTDIYLKSALCKTCLSNKYGLVSQNKYGQLNNVSQKIVMMFMQNSKTLIKGSKLIRSTSYLSQEVAKLERYQVCIWDFRSNQIRNLIMQLVLQELQFEFIFLHRHSSQDLMCYLLGLDVLQDHYLQDLRFNSLEIQSCY